MWDISEIKNNIIKVKKRENSEEKYFDLISYYDMLALNNNLSIGDYVNFFNAKKKYNSYGTFDKKIDECKKLYNNSFYLIEDNIDEINNLYSKNIKLNKNVKLNDILNLSKNFYNNLVSDKQFINNIFNQKIEIIQNPYTLGKTYYTSKGSYVHVTYLNNCSYLSSYVLVHEIGYLVVLKDKNYSEYINMVFSPFFETIPIFMELLLNDYLCDKNMNEYYKNITIQSLQENYINIQNRKNDFEYISSNQKVYSTILAYYLYDLYLNDKNKCMKNLLNFKNQFGKIADHELLEKNDIEFNKIICKNYVKKHLNLY